jgi:hypothetical protein
VKPLSTALSVLLIAALPTAAAPVPKGALSANLVVNGSFEDGKGDEVSRPQDKGSAAVPTTNVATTSLPSSRSSSAAPGWTATARPRGRRAERVNPQRVRAVSGRSR